MKDKPTKETTTRAEIEGKLLKIAETLVKRAGKASMLADYNERDKAVAQYIRATKKIVAAAVREERERIRSRATDHYWDSFDSDKDVILKHLDFILKEETEGKK